MKSLRYKILTAMILLCIGSAFAMTVKAESTVEATPVVEAALQEKSEDEIPIQIENASSQITNPINEDKTESNYNETVDVSALPKNAAENEPNEHIGISFSADIVQEKAIDIDEAIDADENSVAEVQAEEKKQKEFGKTSNAGVLMEDIAENDLEECVGLEPDINTISDSDDDKNTELETQKDVVYAQNSNFKDAIQGKPKTIIVTEPIIWNEKYDSDTSDNTDFTTDTPVEVVLGEHNIMVAENSRMSFSGPFNFTGNGNLFQTGGALFLNGVSLTANGDDTTAITFYDAPVQNGEFTRNLELRNCDVSVLGTDSTGICAVQGANIRVVNTSIICAGASSIGVIGTDNSVVSIYDQSRFDVVGKNAVGMVLSEQASGFLEVNINVSGENSRGSVVSGEGYINSGTITVSGEKAVGVCLKESASKAKNGTIIVTGKESTGIFAEGNLEMLLFSLKAENGIAAEGESLNFILCDIDTPTGGLVSHGGTILLDTCLISELPSDAEIKTRKAQPYLNNYETLEHDFLTYDIGVFGFSVPAESVRQVLPNTLTFSLYDPENSATRTIEQIFTVTWEQKDYDLSTVGDYEIGYQADTGGLPIEIAGTVTIHVYDSSRPWLNYAVRMGDNYTELHFAPRVEDDHQIRLWVSDDGGETWSDYIADEKAQAWGSLGFVATDALKENTGYLIKMELVDGSCAGISPVLSYWRNQREIKWGNGDRDGGDQRPREERSEPPIVQTSMEEKTSEGVELTPSELKDISQVNPDTITVMCNGVKAEFPTDALESTLLEPNESLFVFLEQPEENVFSVRVYAGDRKIDTLGDAQIKVTVPNSGDVKQAVPQSGGEPIPVEESVEGKAVFSISETGTYAMYPSSIEQKTDSPNTKSDVWIWRLLLLTAILLLALYIILRKRRDRI